MRLVVAISGASGVVLGAKTLEALRGTAEVHLVVSKAAEKTFEYEVGKSVSLPCFRQYDEKDFMAPIASSSFPVDGMVVVPCSVKTLAAVAHGFADNLVTRAAENVLRMRKRCVLVVRETPLGLAAIENMRAAHLAGATILPPSVAYYHRPATLADMEGFLVGKILDQFGIPHSLYRSWTGEHE
ncbi:MAG: UbiX family flavin prenyltransferase [Methanobacteriota archaeon]